MFAVRVTVQHIERPHRALDFRIAKEVRNAESERLCASAVTVRHAVYRKKKDPKAWDGVGVETATKATMHESRRKSS